MRKQAIAFPIVIGLFALCTVLAFYFEGATQSAQPLPVIPVAQQQPAEEKDDGLKILGVNHCEQCHLNPGRTTARDLCLLTEAKIVLDEDKHSLAWENIIPDEKNPLAQSMQRALEPLGYKDISEDQRCLSCHANWLKGAAEPPNLYDLGVQCESCHGPASKWKDPHITPDWREKTAAEKLEMGMVEVRDAAARAKQCFSCHIGNPSEGKIVTHDMYAAGHPPLPSVEVETFVSQMPRHWRYLPERGDFLHRAEFIKGNFPDWKHDPSTDLPRTKSVIVSGMVAMRSAVDLMTEEAKTPTTSWPELAVFDCTSCHHDLKRPSWRQQRGYDHPPGRPPVPDWPKALVKVGIRQLAGDNDELYAAGVQKYEEAYKAFETAVTAKPFGDRQQIADAGAALREWLDRRIDLINRSHYDQAASQRALADLLNSQPSDYSDFHSARQIAWAIKMLAIESEVAYPTEWPKREASERLRDRNAREDEEIAILETWRKEVWGPRAEKVEAAFEAAGLNQPLYLKLPAGHLDNVAERMPQALEATSNFDPKWYGEALAKLKTALQ